MREMLSRRLEICRKCRWFFDLERSCDVFLCGVAMEMVSPSSCCREWTGKKVPNGCPYMVEHQMTAWNRGNADGCD